MRIFKIILAFLLPPIAVLLETGIGGQFFLNILLTLIGWVPGVVHALWVLTSRPAP